MRSSFIRPNVPTKETTASPLVQTTGEGWNGRGLLETITESSGQVTTLGYDEGEQKGQL